MATTDSIPIDAELHSSLEDGLFRNSVSVLGLDTPDPAESSYQTDQAAKRERKRQQLSCAECHRRKQQCDRIIPCKRCIDRGVGHLCHVAEAGKNKTKRSIPLEDGISVPARKRRKRAEIEADAARDLIVAKAGSIITQAQAGDESAFGRLQHLVADPTRIDGDRSYVGTSSLLNLVSASGEVDPMISLLPGAQLTVPAPDLLDDLPEKAIFDHLLANYHDDMATALGLQYAPIAIQRYYDNFARTLARRRSVIPITGDAYVPSGAPLEPVTNSFVALLCSLCCLTLQCLPPESHEYLSVYDHPAVLRQRMFTWARQALGRSEIEDAPDLCRIEATLAQGIFLKNESRPDQQYIIHATAVRAAQALGMHRHAAPRWGIDPVENEIRKRLWWGIYGYDRYQSFNLGRPPVINDKHCDVDLPLNIDLRDLLNGQLDRTKPLDQFTDATYLIAMSILAGVVGGIFDRAFATHAASYGTVLELDLELQTLESSLPSCLRAPTPDEKLAHPSLERAHRILMAHICKIRAVLHRPFLLKPHPPPGAPDKYARSRTIVIMLSRQIISLIRTQLDDTPAWARGNFLWSMLLWDAGCQLAIAIRALPNTADNMTMAKKLDAQVCQARNLLEEIGSYNLTAGYAIRMIDFLRSRYNAHWSFGTNALPIDPSLHVVDTPAAGSASGEWLSDSDVDPLAFLYGNQNSDPPSAEAGFSPLNQWLGIGGVFETGSDWQQQLDALLMDAAGPKRDG